MAKVKKVFPFQQDEGVVTSIRLVVGDVEYPAIGILGNESSPHTYLRRKKMELGFVNSIVARKGEPILLTVNGKNFKTKFNNTVVIRGVRTDGSLVTEKLDGLTRTEYVKLSKFLEKYKNE